MFIQQGCIKVIKVTEKKRVLLFQINTNLLKFLLKKVSWKKKNISWSPQKNQQHNCFQ